MDKFRVGQEVRLVRYTGGSTRVATIKDPSVHLGILGTIVMGKTVFAEVPNHNPGGAQYVVLFDGIRSSYRNGGFGVFEYQLEPVYDGDQKSTWDEGSWRPQSVKTRSEWALFEKE